MTLGCVLGHRYAHWHAVQEIPVWQYRGAFAPKPDALGNQPQTKNIYNDGHGGLVAKIETDLDYVLNGKVIEQRRICANCGYTQIDKQRWTV